jgi:hypothetical protein
VEQERQRRGELMRAADVDHISGLRERLPLLVVVIEEAESIYGRLFELDRTRAKQFVQTLRDIASLGRKQGIALVIATQTGTSNVFDAPTRRNLGNTLIFRSEAIVGDQWGVPRTIQLPKLDSGSAYALKYGAVVEFPLTPRPTLPHSPLYHEDETLLLTADGEADGEGDEDMDDGPADGTTRTTTTTPRGGYGDFRAETVAVVGSGSGSRIAALQGKLYRYWLANGKNLAAVEREFSPYKAEGGAFHYEAAAAINAMLRLQGQAPCYKEDRPI